MRIAEREIYRGGFVVVGEQAESARMTSFSVFLLELSDRPM